MNKKILLFSSHYFYSARKAGFHHLATEFSKMGCEVTFVTAPYSCLKFFTADSKIRYPSFVSNLFFSKKMNNVTSIINFSLLHPTTKRLWNDKLIGFWLNTKIQKIISQQDIIIFESNPSLYWFKQIKNLHPFAKYIYRVSDDLLHLGSPKSLIALEESILPHFDIISVPNKSIFDRLIKYSENNIFLHPHGIDANLFDKTTDNPYDQNKINAVFVGNSHFDHDFLKRASRLFPSINFHIIGPFSGLIEANNIFAYGEMKFVDTIKYIKFADIGLQCRLGSNELVKTLADSLKVKQYTYCRLPIVAPCMLDLGQANWFFYANDDFSVERSINDALKYQRPSTCDCVDTWADLASHLLSIK